jgi:hypothetical protein
MITLKFRKRSEYEPPSVPTVYPVGTFVRSEKGYFFISSKDKRLRLISERVLRSWAPPRVVQVRESALANYRIAAKLKFRNGSLIWNISDGKIYLIESGKRRWLKNPEWFYVLGLNPSDLSWNMKRIMHVSDEEIKLHELGEDLV